METGDYLSWQSIPTAELAAGVLAALAAYVTLDFVRRVPVSGGRAAAGWLAASALALGTGLWSLHFVRLAGHPLPMSIAYGGAITAAGWAMGVAVSALALGVGARGSGLVWRFALPCTFVAAAAVGSHVLYFSDLGFSPPVQWQPWPLALALAALTAGLAVALWIAAGRRMRSQGWRALASLCAGACLLGAHRLTTLAAQVPVDAVSSNPSDGLSDTTLTLLASLGSVVLLTTLSILSALESHMRRALKDAVARVDEGMRKDALTQLPSRQHFAQHFESRMADADDRARAQALIFIGLDNFKPVNDLFGRGVGDAVLQLVSARLLKVVGSRGMLARVGGDEFVLFLEHGAGREGAASFAKELLGAIAEPCDIEGRSVPVTGSIGIVPDVVERSLNKAMTSAEAAARHVKRNGGAAFAFFEPSMLGNAREQVELLRDLRQALARNEFELYFQPKVHGPTGEITGAEALLRWNHPQRGMVSPTVFVPIAERHGLIVAIGEWVIDEACRQARCWRDGGLRMRVAINLSVYQLHRPDLADRLTAALRRHQINPDLLTCEITESVAMEDSDGTKRVLERLAATGVHLSIDDFGTGYSSLSYLRKLPVSELKIDRSFVLDLETSADACAVVEAVVKLAHALGLNVVAEGVETEGQNKILRGFGCDQLQGYLFAKPMTATALSLWAMNEVGPRPIDFRESLFKDTLPSPG